MNYWARKQKLPYGKSAEVAARLGVSRSLVSQVMRGRAVSRRVMRALARAMGVPVAVAFPEYREELSPGGDDLDDAPNAGAQQAA